MPENVFDLQHVPSAALCGRTITVEPDREGAMVERDEAGHETARVHSTWVSDAVRALDRVPKLEAALTEIAADHTGYWGEFVHTEEECQVCEDGGSHDALLCEECREEDTVYMWPCRVVRTASALGLHVPEAPDRPDYAVLPPALYAVAEENR